MFFIAQSKKVVKCCVYKKALDISYYYPESCAAVIAASGKEQELFAESGECSLSGDCCSYSCCIEGCLELEKGPRGIPPRPDVMIATNNQCNTLQGWWNILENRYRVPLVVLDYPGESFDREQAYAYVTEQHRDLIRKSGASCAVTLHNKSCKCDLVSARNVGIPQAELGIDMIDRTFLDISRAREQIVLLKKAVCTR